jgi:hypothetical protein
VIAIEAAGADDGNVTENDFNTCNYVLGAIVLGRDVCDINAAGGILTVELCNNHHNQPGAGSETREAVYVDTLEIRAGVRFANPNPYTAINLYYRNGGNAKRLLVGDVDLDGDVDQTDMDIYEEHEGETGSEWSHGDMNGDRVVDNADKNIIERALKVAKNPVPENGSTVTSNAVLQLEWDAGVGAVSHNVYFGQAYNKVSDANEQTSEFKGNQTGIVYRPIGPMKGQTYYWRIEK